MSDNPSIIAEDKGGFANSSGHETASE